MEYIKKITLDINSSLPYSIDAKQWDSLSRFIEFTLISNSAPIDLSNHQVKVFALKPDGTRIFNDVDILDAPAGKVLVKLTRQLLAATGQVNAELSIYGNDNSVLTTKDFIINVLPSVKNEDLVESSDEFSALTNSITKLATAIGSAELLQELEQELEDAIQRGDMETLLARQNSLEATFEQLIINAGNSNAEIVDARVKADNTVYPTLRDRLNDVDSQLADMVNYVQSQNPIGKVKYIGHRGASLIAPENTLPSYELAGELGFWGAECDIYTSKDGVWVLHHDDTVDRMTNGTGKVSDKTLAELKSLTIDAGNNISLYPNLKIPTLEEYLYVCKKWGMVPVIEIKAANNTSDYDSLINLLKKLDFETKAIIISFDRTALTEVRNRSKKIVLQLVTSSMTIDDLNFVKSLGNAMMDTYYTSATKENIELCHSNGILINTWTVDDFNTAKTLETNGIDFITSNILCG